MKEKWLLSLAKSPKEGILVRGEEKEQQVSTGECWGSPWDISSGIKSLRCGHCFSRVLRTGLCSLQYRVCWGWRENIPVSKMQTATLRTPTGWTWDTVFDEPYA